MYVSKLQQRNRIQVPTSTQQSTQGRPSHLQMQTVCLRCLPLGVCGQTHRIATSNAIYEGGFRGSLGPMTVKAIALLGTPTLAKQTDADSMHMVLST